MDFVIVSHLSNFEDIKSFPKVTDLGFFQREVISKYKVILQLVSGNLPLFSVWLIIIPNITNPIGYYAENEEYVFEYVPVVDGKKDGLAVRLKLNRTKEVGYYVNGEREGLWEGYDFGGIHFLSVPFSRGKANGKMELFTLGFHEVIDMKDDQLDGKKITYYKNENIVLEENFES
jgi:antitoxin component YwqK of YwqJK toxin-antitoxin module